MKHYVFKGQFTPPEDFNPHMHRRAPATRVERFAWKHRNSSHYQTHALANAILAIRRNAWWPKVAALAETPANHPMSRDRVATRVREMRAIQLNTKSRNPEKTKGDL